VKFAVKRYWEVCDSVEVEADSAPEAIAVAHEVLIDNTKAKYVPDSINSDPSCDVQPVVPGRRAMKLLIIDLYGDGESLRVCEDKAGMDQLITEFTEGGSDEHFDEFMERKGVELFLTRRISLEYAPNIYGSKVH